MLGVLFYNGQDAGSDNSMSAAEVVVDLYMILETFVCSGVGETNLEE